MAEADPIDNAGAERGRLECFWIATKEWTGFGVPFAYPAPYPAPIFTDVSMALSLAVPLQSHNSYHEFLLPGCSPCTPAALQLLLRTFLSVVLQ